MSDAAIMADSHEIVVDFAFNRMSEGWPKALQKISAIAAEHDSSKAKNPNR
jgi:hypothetical protein